MIAPADERSHRSTGERWFAEAWSFEFTCGEHGDRLSTLATLALFPNRREAWWWCSVLRPGEPLVLCHDDGLALPGWPLEIRGEGLWLHAICEEPGRHWTVATEAFAVAFDDPDEAWRSERGDRVGLAFDLEWESDLPIDVRADGYSTPCQVFGTLQVGDQTYAIDAPGRRSHRWGHVEEVLFDDDRPAPEAASAARVPLVAALPGGPARVDRLLVDDQPGTRWITRRVGPEE